MGGEDEKKGEGACGGRRGRAEGREKEEEETTLVLPCGLFFVCFSPAAVAVL